MVFPQRACGGKCLGDGGKVSRLNAEYLLLTGMLTLQTMKSLEGIRTSVAMYVLKLQEGYENFHN